MLSDFKSPDRTAPRFRAKTVAIYNKEFCTRLRELHPELELTDDHIKEIIFTGNGLAWQTVLDKREGLELFEQLGYIFIGACPRKKGGNIDYKKSEEYGKVIQHKNYDSDELTGKIFYTKFETKYSFMFRELWAFKAVVQFRQLMGRTFPENYMRYIRITGKGKTSRIFRKTVNKERLQKVNKRKALGYDPFDMD